MEVCETVSLRPGGLWGGRGPDDAGRVQRREGWRGEGGKYRGGGGQKNETAIAAFPVVPFHYINITHHSIRYHIDLYKYVWCFCINPAWG